MVYCFWCCLWRLRGGFCGQCIKGRETDQARGGCPGHREEVVDGVAVVVVGGGMMDGIRRRRIRGRERAKLKDGGLDLGVGRRLERRRGMRRGGWEGIDSRSRGKVVGGLGLGRRGVVGVGVVVVGVRRGMRVLGLDLLRGGKGMGNWEQDGCFSIATIC